MNPLLPQNMYKRYCTFTDAITYSFDRNVFQIHALSTESSDTTNLIDLSICNIGLKLAFDTIPVRDALMWIRAAVHRASNLQFQPNLYRTTSCVRRRSPLAVGWIQLLQHFLKPKAISRRHTSRACTRSDYTNRMHLTYAYYNVHKCCMCVYVWMCVGLSRFTHIRRCHICHISRW